MMNKKTTNTYSSCKNKRRPTKHTPDVWEPARFTRISRTRGYEFFLLPSIVHARPPAANANRWARLFQVEKAGNTKSQFQLSIAVLLMILSSCAPITPPSINAQIEPFPRVPTSVATTLTPVPVFTFAPILVTATPPPAMALPTQMTLTAIVQTQEWEYVAIIQEPAELERWQEYEKAIGNALYERIGGMDIICEWQIVGRDERKVYVWTACSGFDPSDISHLNTFIRYAVVYLGENGEVQRVGTIENTPGSSYGDIRRKLFPSDIIEKFGHVPDVDRLLEHLKLRRENPRPPLIVLDVTPTP